MKFSGNLTVVQQVVRAHRLLTADNAASTCAVTQKEFMICVVQQDSTNFFLTEVVTWSSDLSKAAEFKSIREAMTFRTEFHVPDSHVLVFRDRRIIRIDPSGVAV
jgi:hypothetical protein